MGKFQVGKNLLSRAKAFWGWFIKKSPAFIVLTSLTVVSVFGLGVGGTLAATGVISNPFVPPTEVPSAEEIEPSARIPGDGAFPLDHDGFDNINDGSITVCSNSESQATLEDCHAKLSKKFTAIADSGWTGVRFKMIQGGYYMMIAAVPTPGTYESPSFISTKFSVNGVQKNSGQTCFNYGSWAKGEVCVQEEYGPIHAIGACLPGGDTYLIEVSGGGLNFRETGPIPAGVIDCPSLAPTTEPSPTPTSEVSPTPTTEPYPTPPSETSPTPTTEPSPTPTSP